MSLYVQWVNKIKAEATSAWLTDAQRSAYDQIVNRWQSTPFVCLFGASGCGKSFIARTLVREKGYVYSDELRCVQQGSQQVVIDGEEYTRLMRSFALLLGLGRVVVLMSRPPSDRIPTVCLSLGERDIRQFQHNLTSYAVLDHFLVTPDGADLGRILRAEAIARGEAACR